MSLNLQNINGGKFTPGKWKYPPMDGTFLIMKEGVPPWPYGTNAKKSKMVKQPRNHGRKQGQQLKSRKYPAIRLLGMKVEEPNVDTCPLLMLPSSTGTKAEEPKIATPSHKSPSNPGMKEEEPNGDTSPLRKLPRSTGNQDNAAGLVISMFESAAHYRSMCPIKLNLRHGKCKVCSLVDDHPTIQCPYLDFLPEDATFSSGCDLVCNFCGKLN